MKSMITSIEKTPRGSYIVEYYNGKKRGYSFREFYYYSKSEALARMREELGIKRNPIKIRDYTITPRRSLTELLIEYHKSQARN